ncbi:hypothetical protein AX14_014273 [Amanita brunnescens Koide BX004]|nr:hypothetical protein AX14_014273 [Amanita brunnescens Koide BX004]
MADQLVVSGVKYKDEPKHYVLTLPVIQQGVNRLEKDLDPFSSDIEFPSQDLAGHTLENGRNVVPIASGL